MRRRSLIALLTLMGLIATSPLRAALVQVTEDIAAGTTATWTADNQYLLETVIYVQTNATLTIEPGTVVYGATNVTIGRTDIPSLVSALWVTRGGKLMAEGTKEAPIIFTAEGDDLQGNIPATETALWGGVVLLGNATINSAKDATGNAATPKYDVFEGTEGPGDNSEHVFGGDDDTDSSGSLRYVSIRHAGNEFAPAEELNALTLGAVGSGTTLQYIEVFAGSDDGFEWWGGSVNSSHLIAAFIEDDDFDTDQGYRGTNQFWFGIKPPWGGTGDSRAMENDGDLNQSAVGEEPVSRWMAYNATLVGRGISNGGFGGGVGANWRDESAPNVFNAVFTDFNQGLKLDADGLYYWTNAPALADAQNNIWNVTTTANSDGEFVFTETERLNTVQDPMLGGISYEPNGMLDPRPVAGSPVYSDVLAGAPVAVNYRGAFADEADNWADGWTALSTLGYLKPASTVVAPVITAQPEATVSAFPRETVTLAVVATGAEPLGYHWSKDGAEIDGATSAELILENIQPDDAGTYAVVVSNAGGSVPSDASVVTVIFETYDDWATANGLSGDNANPEVDASGDGVINLFVYAFGGDPNGDSTGRLPAATIVDESGTIYPALTYTENMTAVGGTIQVVAASDVLLSQPLNIVLAGVEDLGDGTQRVTWRTEEPASTGAAVFWVTTIVTE